MERYLAIPISMIKNKELTSLELFHLMEISQLAMLDKGCIASNNHFAELFDIKKQSTSRTINSLVEKGYITVEIEDGSRNHNRIITINKMLSGGKQNVTDPSTKCLETKETNTKTNTINTTKEISLIPSWVDVTAWTNWVQHRKEIKRPLTPTTIKQQLKLLEENKFNHVEIIEQSIQNGWTGLFKIKSTPTYQAKQPEVGSIAWRMAQSVNTVDTEVIDVSA